MHRALIGLLGMPIGELRCMQADGWWLEQSEPGVLVWRAPSGRTYTVTPTVYPV